MIDSINALKKTGIFPGPYQLFQMDRSMDGQMHKTFREEQESER